MDLKAEEQRLIVDENRHLRRLVLDGVKVGENQSFRDLIGDNFDQVKKFREEKSKHYDRINLLKEKLKKLEE